MNKKTALVFFAAILFVSGCSQKNISTDIAELSKEEAPIVDAHIDDIVGDWSVQSGDFEEITLDQEKTFYTFLHDLPFDFGIWSFTSGTLLLTSDSGHTYTFTHPTIQDGVLSLESESTTQSWIPIITE